MEGIIIAVALVLGTVILPGALAWVFHQASVRKL